jgi:hypothetical protein
MRNVALRAGVVVALAVSGCAPQTARVLPQGTTDSRAEQRSGSSDESLRMFARGYFPGRSGEIFFIPREGDFLVDTDPLYQFMHGSPWPYDAHVPLLLHGREFVRPGTFREPAAQQDLAPTLASILHIPPPATATGRVLKEALAGEAARPRIAALFVLDGMRADYFDRFQEDLPTLSRLRGEGAWFDNAHATSLPTATSIGHATIGTGADPRVHGLVVNQLFNRVSGKPQEAYDALNPGELMALTVADVWNITTDGRAIILGQGGAIRAVAGLVGHGGCVINGRKVLAASYSTRDAGWETNDACYTVPAPLRTLNGASYWKEAGGRWMGHNIATPRTLRASAVFQRFEGDALAAVLESEALGADEVTDLVLVNVKSPDYVSHAYGPQSPEIRATLVELDRQIARALAILERKATGRLFTMITADHGMPGEPVAPRRRITVTEVVAALDQQFAKGGASVVHYFGDPANAQIHMNVARLREAGVTLTDVATFLAKNFFDRVYTEDEVRAASAALPLGK